MIQFKTLTITITELEQYLNTKINTTRVRDLCYTLKSKTYEVLKQNKKDYDYISLFSKITYKTDDKEIIFKFDDEIKIHILDFASQFVTYNIANIVRFKSKYTISFYERFKLQTQFKKEPMITETITLAELKNILNLQNKYKRTNDFKHKVLEVVKNDMQRYSDVYMNYEYIKKGKTIHSIKFFFTKNNTETQQTFFTDDELETAYDKYINKQYKNKDSDLCTIKQIKSALTDVDYIEVIVFNEFAQANQEVKLSKETLKNLK
jgi:plasmid replication initiation protein